MKKRAIIYDLDNTLYAVSSIGEKLFAPVFGLIKESGRHDEDMDAIKKDLMRTPFRIVAKRFHFSNELTVKAIALQENITFNEPIATFEDYPEIKNLPGDRFLVTTGFKNMQLSKIRQMGIENDFKEVHVVDPTKTSKKEVFADILKRYGFEPSEVIVVGDDPESELRAARELGIDTVLYDKTGQQDASAESYTIKHYKELREILLGK